MNYLAPYGLWEFCQHLYCIKKAQLALECNSKKRILFKQNKIGKTEQKGFLEIKRWQGTRKMIVEQLIQG